MNIAGGDILYLIVLFIVFSFILFVVEQLCSRKTLLDKEKSYPYIPKQIDEDV